MSEAHDGQSSLGTVEGKIRTIVENMGAEVDYRFMNWAQANVELDHIERPTVVYVLPANGELTVSWRDVKDKPEMFIAFVTSTEFDFEGEDNDNIIESMKRLAIRFIRAVNESGYFEQIEGQVPYSVLYDHLDQNVTGVVIRPQLIETEGVRICNEIERR